MKKLSTLFLSLVALAATVISCNSKDDSTPAPAAVTATTALDLTFKDPAGKPAPGVFVTLYSDSDLKVMVDSTTTDAMGMAKFSKNLKSQIYYIDAATDASGGCLTNYTTVNFTTDSTGKPTAIPANKTTSQDVLVVPTEFSTLTNSSTTDAYNVYIGQTPTNGGATQYQIIDELDKGMSDTVSVMAGTWDFKFIKLDSNGDEIAGTDILKPANIITACNTTAVTIP